jgi:hypothetical protein
VLLDDVRPRLGEPGKQKALERLRVRAAQVVGIRVDD